MDVVFVCDFRQELSLLGYIPSHLNSNIKVVEWLPQSDLLAHKNIRAFVSHVGHNSLYESAYHGVPVVAVPLFGDQPANAKKVEHRGFGVSVDYRNIDAQKVFETIDNVVTEPRYCYVCHLERIVMEINNRLFLHSI